MIVPIKKASAVGRQIANNQQRTQSQLTGGYGSSYGYGNTGPAMPTSTKGINVNAKNLWNYYANNAQANGKLAMKDVAAEQTAQTEGYGNSWAQGAASNAYLDYLNQLNGNMAGIIASATPRKSGGRAKPKVDDHAWYQYADEIDGLTGAAPVPDNMDIDNFYDLYQIYGSPDSVSISEHYKKNHGG